jgi:hypothetical protein
MVWVIGACCMILFGAAGIFLGLYLPFFSYAIVGGILLVTGVILLVAVRRSGGPVSRNLQG